MTSKANLPKRVQKARAAARFIGEIKSHSELYSVPGSDGKRYEVRVRRDGVLSFQCWREYDGSDCPGNSNGHNTCCYHSMATAEYLARQADKKIAWCANYDDAKRRVRLGGKIFRIVSHQNNGMMWGVVS